MLTDDNGGLCCGNPDSTSSSASTPPVEEPMATSSTQLPMFSDAAGKTQAARAPAP
ncbi:hypothetical protein [Komagataeibacter saccharivorans]|uniref:hypothetical protein n=1 Tax=Komagataeibacter saccharivorans TaxID=265959 RepID=UPI00215538B7|nr:hypothetical protein [Komagataeibacter saccharivorans]